MEEEKRVSSILFDDIIFILPSLFDLNIWVSQDLRWYRLDGLGRLCAQTIFHLTKVYDMKRVDILSKSILFASFCSLNEIFVVWTANKGGLKKRGMEEMGSLEMRKDLVL